MRYLRQDRLPMWVLLVLGCLAPGCVGDDGGDGALAAPSADARSPEPASDGPVGRGRRAEDGGEVLPRDGGVQSADSARDGADCTPDRDAGTLYRGADAAVVREPIPPSTPIDETGLASYWPLDGDWQDVVGRRHLIPTRPGGFSDADYPRGPTNRAYGPTGFTEENGAFAPDFTELDLDRLDGLTIEGWVRVTGNSTHGVLFGFGEPGWELPKLYVAIDWGHLSVRMGSHQGSAGARFDRIGSDRCWHHVALTLPPGLSQDEDPRFGLYLDGEPATPVDDEQSLAASTENLFGLPFRMGTFTGDQGGGTQLDEVRLWGRSLSPAELGRLAEPRGDEGDACATQSAPDWAPGPRCRAPEGEIPVEVELGVRVVSDDTVVLISDPNRWMKERIVADCGAYLRAMAEADVLDRREYFYAAMETLETYRPTVARAVYAAGHLRVGRSRHDRCESVVTHQQSAWPQGTRELRVPHVTPGEAPVWTHRGEVVYFSYLTLDEPMVDGEHYVFADRWGNRVGLDYSATETRSWAIKLNQVGYGREGPKYAYVGFWQGGAGPMDLSRIEGADFQVRRVGDDEVVYTGPVSLRGHTVVPLPEDMPDATPRNPEGEDVYELDFSALEAPGDYYLYLEGLGRSWPFRIGAEAIGEAYYIHSRGLYHQRCAPLAAAHTAWPRGDVHATYRGLYPPIDGPFYEAVDKAADHSAEGWGFLDSEGNYLAPPPTFTLIDWSKTDELLPDVVGGWHDAADFDRRPQHLYVTKELAQTYLFFPQNFHDGQLNLPESGNGVPDIVDQAAFGVEILRRAQGADGSATIKIEATSHPSVADPGLDTQRYYAAIATRASSLWYANHAAIVARAFAHAGSEELAARYQRSAERAWAFGRDPEVRISTEFEGPDGQRVRWVEPPSPHPRRVMMAAIQLRLSSDAPAYLEALAAPGVAAAFDEELLHFQARHSTYDMAAIAAAPARFPEGWGARARGAIIALAEQALVDAELHAYRRLHANPESNQFRVTAWGRHHGSRQALALLSAWALSGDTRYREPLAYVLDWFQGANPQGRSYTTGLGHYATANLLHLPADADELLEPPPGITPYLMTTGNAYQVRTHLHGLFEGPRAAYRYEGVAEPLMPPPFDNTDADPARIGELILHRIPLWRRYLPFEMAVVSQNEFTVSETLVTKAAVAGALLEPGWAPPASLLEKRSYGPQRFQQDLWLLP